MGGKAKQTPEREQSKARIAPQNDIGDDDENTDIQELPNLDKLEVDIEMDGGFRIFNLEDLSKDPKAGPSRKFISRRVSGLDGLSPTKYGSTKD
jgi:hypothetical protein